MKIILKENLKALRQRLSLHVVTKEQNLTARQSSKISQLAVRVARFCFFSPFEKDIQ